MLDNALLLTILIVLLAALVGAFLQGNRKDICLKSFRGYLVTVRQKAGKRIWGRLAVEATGIELKYRSDYLDVDHIETSFIIYKSEYGGIDMIIRYLDELTPRNGLRREKTLRQSYRPNPVRRLRRRIRNMFNIMRDGVADALNMLASRVKIGPAGAPAAPVQQRFTKVGSAAVESVGNAYEPILEKHIGRKVVLEVTTPAGEVIEYVGVFREYSPDYVEVMDIKFEEGQFSRQVDLIVPRAHGAIRHSAEPVRQNGK